MIPPFLILPLLENAIKHGLGTINSHAFLHLHIRAGTTLEVQLANSRSYTAPAEQKGGIGLQNLRKRLELLYPGRYVLQTEEQPGTYMVSLKILL